MKCGIFRAPSVRTDVERHFSEPSMVKNSLPYNTTRTDDRAHGVGRSPAPLFVPRCRARDVRRSTEPDYANSREDSVYFDLYDEYTEGARHDRLVGVRPQERDQRHTVKQIVDTVLFAPSLDVPVPQRDNQLVEVCRQLDVRIPEQVIEVPKISSPPRHCQRRVRFAEQTAEQLVEVLTIISYSSLLQRTVEQNVDIPVCRGERNVGLQGFPPRQSSTAQLASQERSSEQIVEQIVDSRVLGGGLQDFRPVQGSSASSSSSREHAGEGFFGLFPEFKKVRSGVSTQGRNYAECSSNGST